MIVTWRHVRDTAGVLLAALALLTAGWLYVRFGSSNMARLASDSMGVHADFDSFWRSSVALLRGTGLYETGAEFPNLNPPLVSVLLAPLALLDVLSAYHLFALLTAVMTLGCVIAVAEELRLRTGWAMVAAFALLASSPLHGTLVQGQIYGLLTVALTVAWLAQRRERWVLAGVAVGLAVAVKPSLAPLLLLPLLHRRWPQLAAAVLAGAVGTGVGVLVAGWSATVDWLGLLADAVEVDGFLDNASLAALAVRFDQPAPLGHLAALVLLVVTLWRVHRQPDIALWAVTAAALLSAPIAWHNYLVLLAPAVLVLLAGGRWPWALPLLALPLIGIDWSNLWAVDSTSTRVGYSLYCATLLTYWAVLVCGRDVPTDQDGPPSTNSTAARFERWSAGAVSSSSTGAGPGWSAGGRA